MNPMRMFKLALPLFALSALLGGDGVALADKGPADNCVRSKVWEAYPQGWAVRTITHASLEEGEHRIYMLTLYAGNEYRVMACGDNTMENLDLVIYDADGKLVTQDATTDRQPVLEYKPTATDTFYVAIHAVTRSDKTKGQGKGEIALAVTYR
jgi:hypothetical protein